MEKLLYVFNEHKGALENEEEVFMCEPFFGAGLCQGNKLLRGKDFMIVGEIAVAANPTIHNATKDDELISWLAGEISQLKKENIVSPGSKELAVLIIDKIRGAKGHRE